MDVVAIVVREWRGDGDGDGDGDVFDDVATVRIPFGRNHDDDDEGWACARARRVVG
jgi:hypothetical protein